MDSASVAAAPVLSLIVDRGLHGLHEKEEKKNKKYGLVAALVASQGAVPDSYGEEGFSGGGAFG